MKIKVLLLMMLVVILQLGCSTAFGATAEELDGLWDVAALSRAPHSRPAELKESGVTGVFIEGLPCKGRRTEVFAWYGLPRDVKGKVPGVVLLHGSGATAFADWVRLWTARGYAAIAIDYDGCVPVPCPGAPGWTYHKWGGPCHAGSFDQANLDLKDQWAYHAVANAMLAHSFLLSLPEVDPERTGVTGISWGSYLTLMAAAVDQRYKFAIPVYAAGFWAESSAWVDRFKGIGPEKAARWSKWWDAKNYLPLIKAPLLLVNGTNDPAFFFDSTVKSYKLLGGPKWLCLKVRLGHSHPAAYEQREVYAFADSVVKNGPAFPRFVKQEMVGDVFSGDYEVSAPVRQLVLNYTKDGGAWSVRKWESRVVPGDVARQAFSCLVEADMTAFYLNLVDGDGMVASTIPIIRR